MAIIRTAEIDNIFKLEGVPNFSQFYWVGMYNWKLAYKCKPAWNEIFAPTIAEPNRKRKIYKFNMAKALCSEIANLVWAEGSSISVNQKNWSSDEQDPLNYYIDTVLKDNYFYTKMRQNIEEMLALGGSTIRCFADGLKDEDNKLIDGTIKIGLDYGLADKFVPLNWDNKRVTEAVFIEKRARKGWYWTRLEFHKWNGTEYEISNEFYKTDRPYTDNTTQDILGIRSPMSELWNTMSEPVIFSNMGFGLFSYFKTCMANNLDDNSPLGISIFANALDTLKALDIAFDSLIMEIKLGKKRIIVPASTVRKVRDRLGFEHRYFDANDEVFEALNIDSTENLKIQDNSVELRIDEHIKAINALLNILSVQCGLSEGALSFDSAKGIKTATEVISENSKTYRTIKLLQEPIKTGIENLINSIIAVSSAYDISFEFNGKTYSVYELVQNGYDISVNFDDSIIQDRTTDVTEGLSLVQNKLISRKTFLVKYLGYTPEQADAEMNEIAKDKTSSPTVIDWTNIE